MDQVREKDGGDERNTEQTLQRSSVRHDKLFHVYCKEDEYQDMI